MSVCQIEGMFLPELFEYLQRFLPKTLMICSIIRTLQRGIPVGFNVWVDKWPSPQAVIVNANQEKCHIECWKKLAFVFETNSNAFISLFTEVEKNTINNKLERGYAGISPETFEQLKAAFPKSAFSLHETQVMWIRPENLSKANRSTPLPNGFHIGSMSQALAEKVVAHAPQFEGYIDKDAIFKPATLYECPYIAVLDQNDTSVAWYLQHCIQGSLNFLFVLPELRGRGIGKYLVESLSEKVMERDGVAFIEVEKDNDLSIKIHQNAGFEKLDPFHFVLHLPPE